MVAGSSEIRTVVTEEHRLRTPVVWAELAKAFSALRSSARHTQSLGQGESLDQEEPMPDDLGAMFEVRVEDDELVIVAAISEHVSGSGMLIDNRLDLANAVALLTKVLGTTSPGDDRYAKTRDALASIERVNRRLSGDES